MRQCWMAVMCLVALGDASQAWAASEPASGLSQFPDAMLWVGLSLLALFAGGLIVMRKRLFSENTARKQLEDQNAYLVSQVETLSTYKEVFENSHIPLFRSAVLADTFIMANQACANMYGAESLEEFIGSVHPSALYASPGRRDRLVAQLLKHQVISNEEFVGVNKHGIQAPLLLTARYDDKKDFLDGAVIDATQLKQAERESQEAHHSLQIVLNGMPNPLFVKDRYARYLLVNKTFEEMMGVTQDDVVGRSVYDIVPKELADLHDEMDMVLLEADGAAAQRYEAAFLTPDGVRDITFMKETVMDDGMVVGIVGVMIDNTEAKLVERSLRQAEEQYRMLFMNAEEGFYTMTPDGKLLQANSALARMLGYQSVNELIFQVNTFGEEIYTVPQEKYDLRERLKEERILSGHETRLACRDGGAIWVTLSMRGVFSSEDELLRLEGGVVNITKLKETEQKLAEMATTDPLTGLYNRAGFTEQVSHMLAQAHRSNTPVGVLYLDLDGFKPVNDTYGHKAGDTILVEVARRLMARKREADIVARMGGDEFTVVMWNVDGAEALEHFAHELIDTIQGEFVGEEFVCSIGTSIGGSLFPEQGTTLSELISAADHAMYEAKRNKFGYAFSERLKT